MNVVLEVMLIFRGDLYFIWGGYGGRVIYEKKYILLDCICFNIIKYMNIVEKNLCLFSVLKNIMLYDEKIIYILRGKIFSVW